MQGINRDHSAKPVTLEAPASKTPDRLWYKNLKPKSKVISKIPPNFPFIVNNGD